MPARLPQPQLMPWVRRVGLGSAPYVCGGAVFPCGSCKPHIPDKLQGHSAWICRGGASIPGASFLGSRDFGLWGGNLDLWSWLQLWALRRLWSPLLCLACTFYSRPGWAWDPLEFGV